MSKKKSILVQGGILATAGIISKIIGLLYQAPFTGIVGDEGNGYYSTAYYIYSIVLLISSYSIPSAMSKIISQRLAVHEYRNAQRIFHCALIYVCVVGAIGSLVAFFGAPLFVDGYSIPVLKVFSPFIFIFGPLGVLRGYFQAQRTMIPTSISQLVEQFLNAFVSVGGAFFLVNLAISKGGDASTRAMYGAIGGALGTGSGVVIALIFMFFVYRMNRDAVRRKVIHDHHEDMGYREIFILILMIVTPFILSTFIYNLSTTLNSTLFSKIMTYNRGIPHNEVVTRFGVFSRKAMNITNFPIAISSAAAATIMPSISTYFAQKNYDRTAQMIERVYRLINMIAIPSAVGLFALSEPIIMLLFPQKATLHEAGVLMQILAITVVFYSLSTVSNAILQGIGKVNAPVINAAIALVVQTVVLVILLFFTNLGNKALAIVTILYSLLMCVLNEYSISKTIEIRQDIKKLYIIPFSVSAVMGIVSFGVYRLMKLLIGRTLENDYFVNLISVAVAIFVAVIVYAVGMVRTKGVTERELLQFPKGSKLVNILKKVRIIK
ncbi:putative polysaccharide biosynthesis protein [Butyrivibrio sp. WCE2006]|uniref:putative polysaccharide biosynthesis protein n=1 Tax=Butyrivibrio sp. WCE2006 TaxID=1410611 RepID=UPI0005D17DBD|nr:polysaccharide biosynthesis protein [Butyrivibrio sp. WCE2006]